MCSSRGIPLLRLWARATVTLVVGLLIAAAGSPSALAGAVLRVIMEQVPDYDVVATLTPEFEAANPGIRIQFDAMPYDAMRDRILASFLAPQAVYDIIIVDNPWVDEFGEAGFLTPLGPYIAKTSGYDYEDFAEPLRRTGEAGGQIYGVPYYNYALALILRNDVFEARQARVPATLEEWLQTVKSLTGGGFYGAAMQPQRGYKIFEEWKNLLYAAGGNLFDDQGRVILNDARGLRALRAYIEAYRTAAPPNSLNWGFDEALRAMAGGQAATMISYNWMLPTLNNPDGPAGRLAGRFGLYPVPGGKAVLGAWYWSIPHNTRRKDEAWAYISWITSKAVEKRRVILGGAPVRTGVMQDPEVWEKGYGRDYYETVLKILQNSEPLARGPRAEEIIQEVGTELNAAVAGEKTPEQALNDAAEKVRRIVSR